jgi:hypothetical protein
MENERRHRVSPTEVLRQGKCDREAFAAKRRLPILVVLDQVTQAYNIGAIFRLCDAMLAERLVITGADVDLRKRNLGQAACGTQYWTPWSQEKSAEEAVIRAKADGYQIAIVELASNDPKRLRRNFPCALFSAANSMAYLKRSSIWPTPSSRFQCGAWRIRSMSRPRLQSFSTGSLVALKLRFNLSTKESRWPSQPSNFPKASDSLTDHLPPHWHNHGQFLEWPAVARK